MRVRHVVLLSLVSLAVGCGFLVDTGGLVGEGAADANPPSGDAIATDGSPLDGAPLDTLDGASDAGDGPTGDAPATETSSGARPYEVAVLADNPVLYLPLGDKGDTAAIKNLVGTIAPQALGNLTYGRPGAIAGDSDTSIGFPDGTIDCGSILNFTGQQPFTIEMWVRIPDIPLSESRYLVRKGDVLADGGNPPEAYSIFLSNPGGAQNAFFVRRTSGLSMSTDLVFPYGDNGVHHVVAVYTGSQLLMYKDALLLASDVGSGLSMSIVGSFYVGARNPTSGFATTDIDELAVYADILPQSRIKVHHDIGVGNVPDQ